MLHFQNEKKMKKLSVIGMVLLSLLMTTVGFSQNYPPDYGNTSDDKYYEPDSDGQYDNDRYSYEEFYDDLSPYGSWVNYPQYGYVWIPRVSNDFHPYATEGHWVMTNYGWTWVSDYRWGWAAFHYGRWAYEPRFGWMWIPGRKWGPAWVSWRESDDYFGWAPLGPFGRISINVSCPNDHYRFVQRRHFADRYVHRYYSDWRNNVTIINRTTYINETHVVNKNKYFYGPRKDYVERATGQQIRVANVSDRQKPDADFADNDNVKVYRPKLDNAPTNGRRAAPKQVVNAADLQPVPTDRRLTPSVRTERPQNADGTSRDNREGGQTRPQRLPRRDEVKQETPNPTRQQMPNTETRPQRQPRRDEVKQEAPNPTRQQMPNTEARPQRLPRRDEVRQEAPNPTRQQTPNTEARPQRQPRKEEGVQRPTPSNPSKVEQPRKERANPQPANEKQAAPQGKRNREHEN